jgi:hypothetical protein
MRRTGNYQTIKHTASVEKVIAVFYLVSLMGLRSYCCTLKKPQFQTEFLKCKISLISAAVLK